MHDTTRNISTVQSIYAAFGRGDVPTILEHLRDDVDWEHAAPDFDVPWLQAGRGREHVLRFFQTIGRELVFSRFEVLTVAAEGPWVIALTRLECTLTRNGATLVEACEPHIWRFDEHGRVESFRHAADTYRQWRAWHA